MTSGTVFALIVEQPGTQQAMAMAMKVVAADERPDGALTMSGGTAASDLLTAVYPLLDHERKEWPRPVHVIHNQPLRAGLPGQKIHGASADLAVALCAIADLYGIEPQCDVYATGAADGSDLGHVQTVDELERKADAAAARAERRLKKSSEAILLLPDQPPGSPLRQRSWPSWLRVHFVERLTQAAQIAFGEAFQQIPERVAQARTRLAKERYSYRYREVIANAESLLTELQTLPEAAMLRRRLAAEALAIGRWAASRIRPSETLAFGGCSLSPDALCVEFDRRLAALGLASDQSLWPELRALLANFAAATHLGASMDFSKGIALADEALGLRGLVEDHHGEKRKLLGTRAQLRWRQGLRTVAAGQNADGRKVLDQAVEDARAAYAYCQSDEISETNDRARVQVYLAHALISRGSEADLAEADRLLQSGLGFDAAFNPIATPQQDPGWALRTLYLDRIRRDPGFVYRHWRHVGSRLPVGSDSRTGVNAEAELQTVLRDHFAMDIYDESLAAFVARAAVQEGDLALAAALTCAAWNKLGSVTALSLRTLAWWWPLLACDEPAIARCVEPLRVALHESEEPAFVRPEGPARDDIVDDLLDGLRSSSEATRHRAWTRLCGWIGEPALKVGRG